jgi:hypothetical protein
MDTKTARRASVGGVESIAVEQHIFQGGEEALAEGFVVAISDGAHRRSHPGSPTALAKGH